MKDGQQKTVHFEDGEDMNNWQQDQQAIPILADYDQYRVTKEKDIPQPKPTITIAGAAVASPGNITGISAAAKAGKTALAGVILAGAISKTGEVDGFNDLAVIPNTEGKAVIHFDTEQSEADQQYFINTILLRAKIENTPDYYRSYNIRQLNLENYQVVTDSICELANEKFNGIHLIVIDGGADYIASVNDEEGANKIIRYFIHLSIEYNCPVIVLIHLNPGSDKERGHFGSQFQRKCYGLITVIKDGDISTAQPKIMRKAGNGEIPLLHFTYNKEKGYHVQVDAPDKADNKAVQERERLRKIAETVFAPPASFSHKQAIEKIMNHTSRKISTAKMMLENMTGFGFVDHGSDKNYRLNVSEM